MAPTYTQEMPPKGGYSNIEWARQFAPKALSGRKVLAAFFAVKIAAFTHYVAYIRPKKQREKRELQEARIAVAPFLMAESDRAYLKHLRAVRDEERELMKDVPGWQVGKYYDQPIYHNMRDRFLMPDQDEVDLHHKPTLLEKLSTPL